MSVPQKYAKQRLRWSTCRFDSDIRSSVRSALTTRCARVLVAMDWKHPTAHRDITLSIAYTPRDRQSEGLLTSNPGGPGADGLQLTAALAVSKPALFTSFDLLGFDPGALVPARTCAAWPRR